MYGLIWSKKYTFEGIMRENY